MTKNRNISDLLDANGDVKSGALDNVPASNDASALTTGTLPIARIADGDVATAKIADGAVTSAKLASGAGGKVLQVVTATDSTVRQTTSTSFVTASNTLSVSITPSSSSNKILIMVNCGQMYHNNSNQISHLTVYRGATDLGSNGNGLTGGNTYPASDYGFPTYMAVYDSPNTTSATTYQVYIRTSTGTINLNESGRKATIIAMEIGA